ncbi:MAG: sigma-54-dependent Fis family transcriptional regulator [Deltaproteobacteria bacterium]|nr:sigma-54-dependent Fis family transcriptional regulator [Deltaproteobacteria bacterium]
MYSVLIIDDEIGIRETLSLILKMEGYEVQCAESATSGLELLDSGKYYDYIVCDVKMPGMDGIQFLKEIQIRDSGSILIMITAYGTLETSIEAIKAGASEYIGKPINTEELLLRMAMAKEREKLKKENLYLRKELGKGDGFEEILFESDKMREVISLARKASQFKTTVLITGESGTGKELIARAIHRASPRNEEPFVAINCSAIPEQLLESELFGYVKGAFSGADRTKRGLFEEAHGGTLLLDEIGDLPLQLQTKFLRVLQEEEIRRLGDTKTIKIDVRIIAATSSNLNHDIELGKFRNELFYRLNVLRIHIPPLRERKEDIHCLLDHFIKKFRRKLNPRIRGVSEEVMSELLDYPWYGNVRELGNVIERGVLLSDSDIIQHLDLRPRENEINKDFTPDSPSLEEAWERLEKYYIEKALFEAKGNRTEAAKLLGLSRRSLHYKLKHYGQTEDDN